MEACLKEFRRDVLSACNAGEGVRAVALRSGAAVSNSCSATAQHVPPKNSGNSAGKCSTCFTEC